MRPELEREEGLKLNYLLTIEEPANHMLSVKLTGKKKGNSSELKLFLPSWSPGSYLMREYGRHISQFQPLTEKATAFFHEQVEKGVYSVKWDHAEFLSEDEGFQIQYNVYCHELTVRTSHIDSRHAFLHGPSLLMGVLDQEMKDPEIEIRFPPVWTKLSTGLKDISTQREIFRYTAADYDDLIDSPIEIGNQETDGFRYEGIDHESPSLERLTSTKKTSKKISR